MPISVAAREILKDRCYLVHALPDRPSCGSESRTAGEKSVVVSVPAIDSMAPGGAQGRLDDTRGRMAR